jgi:hypothetical protein
MHGNIFALAIIAMICASVAVLKLFGVRSNPRRILGGVALAVFTFCLFGFMLVADGCDRGVPIAPILLSTLFVGAVCATVPKRKYVSLIWVLWFLLYLWGSELCHFDGYVGNPHYENWLAMVSTDDLNFAQYELRKAVDDKKDIILPQGWLEESWQTATGEKYPGVTEYKSGTVGTFWHTWFSGIYSLQTRQCRIWCPGGPVESCAETIEIRAISRDKKGSELLS